MFWAPYQSRLTKFVLYRLPELTREKLYTPPEIFFIKLSMSGHVMPDHIIQKCSPAFFPFLIVYLYARIKNGLGEPRITVSSNFISKECSGL